MSFVLPRHVEIRVAFRSGWRWPLRETDSVEVWRGNELLGSLSGETVRHLIQHHMADYELQREVHRDMTRLDHVLMEARKPLAKFTTDRKAALRAARKRKR